MDANINVLSVCVCMREAYKEKSRHTHIQDPNPINFIKSVCQLFFSVSFSSSLSVCQVFVVFLFSSAHFILISFQT